MPNNIINATSTGSGGLITTAADSGSLDLQSDGTTIATIDSTGLTMAAGKKVFSEGSVIQVVGSTDQTRVNTASTSFVALGTSATITPKSASNKILIIASTQCYTNNPSGYQAYYTLYRGATNLGDATDGFGWIANAEAVGGSIHISYLDSPSTTSATTYALYGRSSNAAATVEFSGSSGVRHSIVLMEIVA